MGSDDRDLAINQITEAVTGCAFRVHNTLGVGFVEKVYENALTHEIRKAGLAIGQQVEIKVYYDQRRGRLVCGGPARGKHRSSRTQGGESSG